MVDRRRVVVVVLHDVGAAAAAAAAGGVPALRAGLPAAGGGGGGPAGGDAVGPADRVAVRLLPADALLHHGAGPGRLSAARAEILKRSIDSAMEF